MLTADIERSHLMAQAETATELDRIAEITRLLTLMLIPEQELHQFYLDLVSTPWLKPGLAVVRGGWRMRVALADCFPSPTCCCSMSPLTIST